MQTELAVLRKENARSPETYRLVESIAHRFLAFLRRPDIEKAIAAVHTIGASSLAIQNVILPGATELGFCSEKRGLFSNCDVPGLRPDYYAQVGDSGILLEVERGKTTSNNMDFLDFWKCHICDDAEFLFLLVPHSRPSANGTALPHFKAVRRRLSTFFIPKNYVRVEAVFIFGY